MEFRIALCDDDILQQQRTLSLLDSYTVTGLSVHSFDDGTKLLKSLPGEYDLFLLDILMPGLDGISLARLIRKQDTETPIIFLTSSADYALEAFSVSAFQYLTKPVNKEDLYNALQKLITHHQNRIAKDGFIMVQTREHMRRVPFSSIVCVELWGRSLRFTMLDGEVFTSRAVRVSFASAIAPLLTDERFLNAHKSYVLNMEQVHELRPRSFILQGGYEIPIPRHKYTEAKSRYLDYLSAKGIGMVSHAP